jgi:quercetin dioxygenase-like cupin family protein
MVFKYLVLQIFTLFFMFSGRAQSELLTADNELLKYAVLFPKGEKITNANFTGTVYLQTLVKEDLQHPTSVGSVTFEPGARTKWHIHPGGQILLVTEGIGYYQEKGFSKKTLKKGDVVKCPPNTPHWHGASVTSFFVQIAITNTQNGATIWLNEVVEDEYKR